MIGCLRTRVHKQPIMRFILSLRLYSSFITSKTESRRLHNWGTTFTLVSGSMIFLLLTRVSFFAVSKNKILLDVSEIMLLKYLANLLDMKWLSASVNQTLCSQVKLISACGHVNYNEKNMVRNIHVLSPSISISTNINVSLCAWNLFYVFF